MGSSERLRLSAPTEPLYLEDDGEWHSLGELLAVMEPEFVPADEAGMGLFLACYDAWPAGELLSA